MDRAEAGEVHKGNARTQREEQADPRPLRLDQDNEGSLCKVEIFKIEDIICEISEVEIIEVVLGQVENVREIQIDREEILQLFVKEKSALV